MSRCIRVVFASIFLAVLCSARAAIYYVDYSRGGDDRSGTSPEQAWKHAPGDSQAEARPAAVELQPGDTVQFKSGVVYRGSVRIPADGAEGKRIVYRGTGWGEGRAVLDGSETLSGWEKLNSAKEAAGNPHFAKLYRTRIQADSPFLLNLHERSRDGHEDEFLWMAQSPNPKEPFFFDRIDSFHPVSPDKLTPTSVTAPEVFTQKTPGAYDGASLLLWVNPNQTIRLPITGFDPDTGTVRFPEIPARSIYGNRDQFFALYNHPLAIDSPGEFSVGEPDEKGERVLILWPRSGTEPADRISRSVRSRGIDINGRSQVEVSGFHIRKFAGPGTTDGCGIIAATGESRGLWIHNNEITHNLSGRKAYGGIHFKGVKDSVIEGNRIWKVMNHRGIFLTGGCENVIVRGNELSHTGTTALGVYTGRRIQILDNRISHIYATHANAITLYIACEQILVAGNEVTEASNPMTFQDSGPLYFIGNFTDGLGVNKNVNEWSNTRRGPWAVGEIVFLHNTFVNAEKSSSLSLGKDPEKRYVVLNNQLDGLALQVKKNTEVDHRGNVYTSLNSFQASRYGWELHASEKLSPEGEGGHPAVPVKDFLPVSVFPDVDFSRYLHGAAGRKPAQP